jgi:hypothetical protein
MYAAYVGKKLNMHNRIEKSGFHAGEYVGYMDGPWQIKKEAGGLWSARKKDGTDYFRASSLENIGNGLDQRATRVALGA